MEFVFEVQVFSTVCDYLQIFHNKYKDYLKFTCLVLHPGTWKMLVLKFPQ